MQIDGCSSNLGVAALIWDLPDVTGSIRPKKADPLPFLNHIIFSGMMRHSFKVIYVIDTAINTSDTMLRLSI